MEQGPHIWIAELQNAKGEVMAYHSFELDPKHYETRKQWNEAHRSWSAFRQRERKNLLCNRGPKCKAEYACAWLQPDHIQFMLEKPEVTHHKTIWDVYYALGYDYKAKVYHRPLHPSRQTLLSDTGTFMAKVPWTANDPDIVKVLKCLLEVGMDHNTPEGFLRVVLHDDEMRYNLAFFDMTGVHGSEMFTDVRLAIHAWLERSKSDNIRRFSFLGKRTAMRGEKYGPQLRM